MRSRSLSRLSVLAAALGLALAACSARPYQVAPPDAVLSTLKTDDDPGNDGQAADAPPRPRVISLCYGAGLNSDEDVVAEARYLCQDGTVERVGEEDFFWNGCALFQPFRASFICTPAKE